MVLKPTQQEQRELDQAHADGIDAANTAFRTGKEKEIIVLARQFGMSIDNVHPPCIEFSEAELLKFAAALAKSSPAEPVSYIDYQQRRGSLRIFATEVTHRFMAAATRDDYSMLDCMQEALEYLEELIDARASQDEARVYPVGIPAAK